MRLVACHLPPTAMDRADPLGNAELIPAWLLRHNRVQATLRSIANTARAEATVATSVEASLTASVGFGRRSPFGY